MCGVLAAYDPSFTLNESMVWKAVGTLRPRGPDGEAVWCSEDNQFYLAHTRLSINDPEFGYQPISSEDGMIKAVVNGEIYNYKELRSDLEKKGHIFFSRSDSEVVVHLYEEVGLELFSYLRGEFAIIVFDQKRNLLVAARDLFGVKPLVFSHHGSQILIASQAKAILQLGHPASWCQKSLRAIALFSYMPITGTLFDGINQLPPGKMLVCQQGKVDIKTYTYKAGYSINHGEITQVSEAVSSCREVLEESVRLRTDIDSPYACCLSGGIDSSSIFQLATNIKGSPPDCFSVSFPNSPYDELSAVESYLKQSGAKLHVIEVDDEILLRALPEAVFAAEGLTVNGHLSAKYIMFEQVRAAGFKVILTGEGADELFLGYPHFKQDLLASGDPSGLLKKESYESIRANNILNAHLMVAKRSYNEKRDRLPSFLRAKYDAWESFRSVLGVAYESQPLLSVFDCDLKNSSEEEFFSLDASVELWNKVALSGYILRVLSDGTEMAHAVEGRPPFLDLELRDLVGRFSKDLLIRDGIEKWVLREAMKGIVPESVLSKPKHPFFAPPLRIFEGERIKNSAYDLLFGSRPEFVERDALERFVDLLRKSADTSAYDGVLWQLMSLGAMKNAYGLL